MWESPKYKFEEDAIDENGEMVKKQILINVTYSAPRNLDGPGRVLMGVFDQITQSLYPKKANILDIGTGKLRNSFWFLEKGFKVLAVEFLELEKRLPDAKKKWDLGRNKTKYPNFQGVISPNDFINMEGQFDLILLINVINVMPIPLERFNLLALCRQKISNEGMLLWHNWRGTVIHKDNYSDENHWGDGYLMGSGPNHTFYVEYSSEETHEMLYSVGFTFDRTMRLHNIPGNNNYSFIYRPTHEILVFNALNIEGITQEVNIVNKNEAPEKVQVLKLYIKELDNIPKDRQPPYRYQDAHKYHLLASRIFFEIFKEQLDSPKIEREINQGRGRIDIVYKNKNKNGIFKNLKEVRDIHCPDIFVECKNYNKDLTNNEFNQLASRLNPKRGMLGFLLCRDKGNKTKIIEHCKDRQRGGNEKYIIVLDDQDLKKLADFKLNEKDDDLITSFIDDKICEIID